MKALNEYPTPRTDKEDDRGDGLIRAHFARQIERENAALRDAVSILLDDLNTPDARMLAREILNAIKP